MLKFAAKVVVVVNAASEGRGPGDRKYGKRTHRLKCTKGIIVVREIVYNFFLSSLFIF